MTRMTQHFSDTAQDEMEMGAPTSTGISAPASKGIGRLTIEDLWLLPAAAIQALRDAYIDAWHGSDDPDNDEQYQAAIDTLNDILNQQ